MKRIILFLFAAVSLGLLGCNNTETRQIVRMDRLFEEFDFRFFELLEDERIVSANINLRQGQTTIFWRSNLQRDFVFAVNENCELEQCGKESCIIISTETGNMLGIAFLLPEEAEDVEQMFSEQLKSSWQKYKVYLGTTPPLYE